MDEGPPIFKIDGEPETRVESKSLFKTDNPKIGRLYVQVWRARLENNYEYFGSMKPGVNVTQGEGREMHYEPVEDGGRRP